MSDKKQTAVDKLVESLFNSGVDTFRFINEIQQAKELERQQHEKTYLDSTLQFDNAAYMDNVKPFEQYYNETYGEQQP